MLIVNFLVLFGAKAPLPRRRLRRHFLKLGILKNETDSYLNVAQISAKSTLRHYFCDHGNLTNT